MLLEQYGYYILEFNLFPDLSFYKNKLIKILQHKSGVRQKRRNSKNEERDRYPECSLILPLDRVRPVLYRCAEINDYHNSKEQIYPDHQEEQIGRDHLGARSKEGETRMKTFNLENVVFEPLYTCYYKKYYT